MSIECTCASTATNISMQVCPPARPLAHPRARPHAHPPARPHAHGRGEVGSLERLRAGTCLPIGFCSPQSGWDRSLRSGGGAVAVPDGGCGCVGVCRGMRPKWHAAHARTHTCKHACVCRAGGRWGAQSDCGLEPPCRLASARPNADRMAACTVVWLWLWQLVAVAASASPVARGPNGMQHSTKMAHGSQTAHCAAAIYAYGPH